MLIIKHTNKIKEEIKNWMVAQTIAKKQKIRNKNEQNPEN